MIVMILMRDTRPQSLSGPRGVTSSMQMHTISLIVRDSDVRV